MALNTFVLGLQWGDEGKGKVVDALAPDYDLIARAQGGANAGHTIVIGGVKHALHLLPSGVLRAGKECVLGNGMAFDPEIFLQEIDRLDRQGIRLKGRLFVSDRAHLLLPYHKEFDRLSEEGSPKGARIGTTKKGIGPCYADKALRTTAIRVGELNDPAAFRARLKEVLTRLNPRLKALGGKVVSPRVLADHTLAMAIRIRPFMKDTVTLLHDRLGRGRRMMFEGAQGAMLDLDFGTYPYVTSSSASVGGVCTGLGVPPRAVGEVLGVAKAYTTRVGEGGFPTECTGAEARMGERLRSVGHEYGTTTGRPRRCGWLDMVQLRYAIAVNGVDAIALTKLDVLDGLDSVRIGTGYRVGGRRLSAFPASAAVLDRIKPVYEEMPGWSTPTAGARRMADLPKAAKAYVARVQALAGIPVRMVSVGADRGALIHVVASARTAS